MFVVPFLFLLALVVEENFAKHPNHPPVRLTEDDRIQGYKQRNYSWPIEKFVPDTEGWRKLMTDRIGQVGQIEDRVSQQSTLIPNPEWNLY